jgi:hypothetical protein
VVEFFRNEKGFTHMRLTRQHLLFVAFCTLLLSPLSLVAQSVSITPGYVSIGVKGTAQYSATVTGLTNKAVTWSLYGLPGVSGSISTSGLYTAPAAVPLVPVVIVALASDKKTTAAVYVDVAPAGPTVKSISPAILSTGTYTATLTGTGFQPGALVWVAGVEYGTTYVNSTTVKVVGYQASPATVKFQVSNPGTLLGAAFSVAVKAATPQTISPTAATVDISAKQQFTSSGATSWTASAGTISTSGLYTAPATLPANTKVTVTATGIDGSASATVTLIAPQTIAPLTATLNLGAKQQFTSNVAATWTASVGTISTSGLYTAPAALPASSNVTITATGANGSASAAVTLIAPTPVIQSVGSGTLPLGIFSTTITGTGFGVQSVAKLNGVPQLTVFLDGALSVSGFYGESGVANMTVSNGATSSAAFPVQIGVKNALASAAASRRFLEQAAFGPTPADATHVQTIGFQGWLNEQYALPQISNYDPLITRSQGGMPAHFATMAVNNQDQLRQRVALALNEIFVTSIGKLIWNGNMVPYQDMLLADSFTNYRQIMGDVTLSAAMGQYLDMANNAKADPTIGSLANENYARELLQLFTTGTNLLNQNGTLQLDGNGLPIPVYSQFTITEFARVYTGWTYAPGAGQAIYWGEYANPGNLVPFPAEHDMGSKQLLNGYVSPAGATPQQDLNNALDNIFAHPNLGPFVGTQLIQHLVKSNPSSAYVGRVAAAFNNNGHQVRGDMKAVITAVLLDPEARANDEGGKDLPTDGHLQEPAVFIPAMVRALGGQMSDQNYYPSDFANMGEDLFNSPSVFNFFGPAYEVPGTTLMGGEFQIDTPNNAIIRANEVSSLIFSQWASPLQTYGAGTSVDLTPFVSLASSPTTLVDALDLTFTHGVMPATMKSQIASAISADSVYGPLHQVQTGCFLILSSYYYNVWH